MKGRKSIAWTFVFCALFCLLSICSATDDVNAEENQELSQMELQDVVEPLPVASQDAVAPPEEEIPAEEMDQPQPEEDVDVSQDEPAAVDDDGERDATADLGEDQMEAGSDEPEGEEHDGASKEEREPVKSVDSETDFVRERSSEAIPNSPSGQASTDSLIEDEKNSAKNGEMKSDDPSADPLNQEGSASPEEDTNQSNSSLALEDSSGDEGSYVDVNSLVDENSAEKEKRDPEAVQENQPGEQDKESGTGVAEGYTEEALIQMGCKKAIVQAENGAELFDHPNEETAPIGRIENGQEVWVLLAADETWAEAFLPGRTAPEGYARGQDFLIIQEETRQEGNESEQQETVGEQTQEIIPEEAAQESKTEKMSTEAVEDKEDFTQGPNRPPRQVIVTSSLGGKDNISVGSAIVLRAELINFSDSDVYSCQWQYSEDGENYFDVPGANDATYVYRINFSNYFYSWRILVNID